MHHTAINSSVDSESVRLKAYELWVKGGKRDGVADQNWLEAERVLRSTEASISTYDTPKSVAPVASAPKTSAVVEAAASTPTNTVKVPQSSPPASAVVSVTNQPNQKVPAKANGFQNGRKR